jgi:hypothetical protein
MEKLSQKALSGAGAVYACRMHPQIRHKGPGNCPICSMPLVRSRQSAGVTLVKGDLAGIVRARALSRTTTRNIRQNLAFAFVYNVVRIPIAAGALYPAFGILLSPMVAALAMSLSSVSVIANALRLRSSSFSP